jgi:hypothetical protein
VIVTKFEIKINKKWKENKREFKTPRGLERKNYSAALAAAIASS